MAGIASRAGVARNGTTDDDYILFVFSVLNFIINFFSFRFVDRNGVVVLLHQISKSKKVL